jgi:hypothetical protein
MADGVADEAAASRGLGRGFRRGWRLAPRRGMCIGGGGGRLRGGWPVAWLMSHVPVLRSAWNMERRSESLDVGMALIPGMMLLADMPF